MRKLDAVVGHDQVAYLRFDENIIGYVRYEDGEIMLNEGVADSFDDDEFLTLLKVGRKPAMFYGENNIFTKADKQ